MWIRTREYPEIAMNEFAKVTEAKYEDGYIRFVWNNQDEKRIYEISAEALQQSFGAEGTTGSELLAAFEKGRDRIIQAVEKSLNTPTDGVIELGSGDFDS
jgi:hypothetical protein